MQFLLKFTPLGVPHHVFRVISVDGAADVEHVLNLAHLSFSYQNYPERQIYNPTSLEALWSLTLDPKEREAANPDVPEHYGPQGDEFAPFWQQELSLSDLALQKIDLQSDRHAALQRFDELIAAARATLSAAASAQATQSTAASAASPSDENVVQPGSDILASDSNADNHRLGQSDPQRHMAVGTNAAVPRGANLRFKFVYVVHGVMHLVEVLMAEEKLKCFIPATLMGEGLIEDNEGNLSRQMLQDFLVQHEDDDDFAEGLNLKECTSRMRALGAFRANEQINEALLQAGAVAIKYKSE